MLRYGNVGGVGWPVLLVQLLAMKRRVEVTPHLDVVSAEGGLQTVSGGLAARWINEDRKVFSSARQGWVYLLSP